MILRFSLENYKCFKEETVLDFVASNYDKDLQSNIVSLENLHFTILKSIAIYGPNANGKTKLLESIGLMKMIIKNSMGNPLQEADYDIHPFRLDLKSRKNPIQFEIVFYCKGNIYRYGMNFDSKRICTEWLFKKRNNKVIKLDTAEEKIFTRETNDNGKSIIEVNKEYMPNGYSIVKDRENILREDVLFLSLAFIHNDPLAKELLEWFNSLNIISSLEEETFKHKSIKNLKENKPGVLKFLKDADLDIEDIQVEDNGKTIKSIHKVFNGSKQSKELIEFDFFKEESEGTKRFFALSYPILDTLKNGKVLLVDEMESSIHPLLARKLLELFHSEKTNPNHAQLIFTTHNVDLLHSDFLRRDQIWLVEKDSLGVAKAFSLNEINTRKDGNYRINYLIGRYGAIPVL